MEGWAGGQEEGEREGSGRREDRRKREGENDEQEKKVELGKDGGAKRVGRTEAEKVEVCEERRKREGKVMNKSSKRVRK